MARKDVLKGLMGMGGAPKPDDGPRDTDANRDAAPAVTPPRPTRGAIGAVSRSIADLKARAMVEIDPHLIDAGGLADRLETDEGEDSSLRASIGEYGQQVPVLVRPHPETEGRYQIVYGRRRVLALRDLGLPVKALIRDLDDRELILAQGQENTARRELSFIEKVNFSRQMQENGYDRKVICDALSIDKTLASRMLSIAERIPPDIIAAIGAAPSVGRDRWIGLADMIAESEVEADDIIPMIAVTAASPRSDDRFQATWDYLTGLRNSARAAPRAASESLRLASADGLPLGQAKFDQNFCTLKLRRASTRGFEDWLLENLPSLYSDWQNSLPPDNEN